MFIVFRKTGVKLFWKVDGIINGINRRLYRWWVLCRRYNFCNRMFNELKYNNSTPICRTQWKEIKSYWINELKMNSLKWRFEFCCMGKSIKRWFSAYNTVCDDKTKLKYYLPEEIYYTHIDSFLSKPLVAKYFDDKCLYDLYFYDVLMPKTLFRKMSGQYFDEKYQKITREDIVGLVQKHNSVVCKKSVCSVGGKGVVFFDLKKDSLDSFMAYLEKENELIIQAVLQQHPILSGLHCSSINTIRIMTFYINGNYSIVSTVLRMGTNGSKVDNASSGGIVCGITDDGRLKDVAYDVYLNKYENHPSGSSFKDVVVPGYRECCDTAIRLAPRLLSVSRLISWDFAVSKEGQPILIEANMTYGQLDFHQMCNGPLFGDQLKSFITPIVKEI